MNHPVEGIDHTVFLVSDLDATATRFEKLGFTLSPRGTHSPHMGSANYTIVFPNDYFELLGIVSDTPHNASKRAILDELGDSLMAIACRIDDAKAARAALANLGITTGETTAFSRPLSLPHGSNGVAEFSIAVFDPIDVPRGEMFMCEHKTPDMVWRPELMSHSNGAYALAGIVLASPAPDLTADAFARLFAAGRVKPVEGGSLVETGDKSAPILCLTHEALLVRYPRLSPDEMLHGTFAVLKIAVSDISVTRSCLEVSQVGYIEAADGKSLFVAPSDAAGSVLEFVAI